MKDRYTRPMPTKLTTAKVRAIRRAAVDGAAFADLARDYGVHENTVASAVYGLTWGGVGRPGPLPRPEPTGRQPANSALTADLVASARRAYLDGQEAAVIARDYDVAPATILAAIHGRTWVAVTQPPPVPPRKTGGRRPALDVEQTNLARTMTTGGAGLRTIGAEFGVAHTTVRRALVADPGKEAGQQTTL